MTDTTPQYILAALGDPHTYGLPADTVVEHRQTHISHVFLTADRAYKLKKRVDFGFLDFSTVEQRERFCREEVRLNRRLAPDVYLDVVPVTVMDRERVALNGEGPTIDWAVVMVRLPDDAHLAARIARGEAVVPAVESVAARLVRFYEVADTSEAAREFGRLATVTHNWDENFEQTAAMVGHLLDARQYSTIAAAVTRFLHTHGPVLDRRSALGFVGDFHGDLRCEHIYLLPDRVEIIDCVEFTERFRCCDAVNDLAFLGMDLDRLDTAAASRALLVAYATGRPDPGAYAWWDFFKCYRSYVRGKVAGFTAAEPEVPDAQRCSAREQARAAFEWAGRYAERFLRPPCIVLSGPMGSGKSTVAAALAEHADLAVVNTDVVRKELAGLPPTARVNEAEQAGLYAPAMSARTYRETIRQAGTALREGRGVVLDGTFNRRDSRKAARDMARDAGAVFLLVRCELDPEENLRRLQTRLSDDTRVSDARPDLLAGHLRGFEPVREDEAQRVIAVDLARPIPEVEHAVLQGVFLAP